MTKAERAVRALREAADAIDNLGGVFRRSSILGGAFVNPETLRQEATWIESVLRAIDDAKEEA